jgi:hypothetical protein
MKKPSRTRPAPDATLEAAVYSIEGGLERLRAEMGATREAVQLRGAEAKPLTGQTQRMTFAPGRILGFAVLATDPSGAVLRIRDGEGGTSLVPLSLAAGESAREWWGPAGVATTAGVYVELVSGSVEGTIFVGGA